MKSITIVIPVFNEGAAIDRHLAIIFERLELIKDVQLTILVVDDGSSDNTVAQLDLLDVQYPNLNFICLSRNFGKEAAIQAGLAHSQGDAVIVMDSDLQHPPELIPQMIHLWQQGVSVVEAYKISRGKESFTARLLAYSFYHVFDLLAGMNIKNHSDFKLLDRKVVEAYSALPERQRFFRGMIPWLGFTSAQIPFEVPERQHGTTAWSRLRLLKLSLTAITTFSSAPLQVITFLGAILLLVSLVFGSLALYQKFSGVAVSGFATVILLLLLIGSLLMIALGIIGVYIAHIYDEVKQRPSYLIDWRRSHQQESNL
jgi:dolichol-phosphate mannosyltransferase